MPFGQISSFPQIPLPYIWEDSWEVQDTYIVETTIHLENIPIFSINYTSAGRLQLAVFSMGILCGEQWRERLLPLLPLLSLLSLLSLLLS